MQQQDTPKVGDGATFTLWTDSFACTVIDVKRNGRLVILQEDKATLLNGVDSGEPDALRCTPGGFCAHWSGTQRYSYERNPEGRIFEVSKRVLKSGKVVWKRVGCSTLSPGGDASFNGRHAFHDYNF